MDDFLKKRVNKLNRQINLLRIELNSMMKFINENDIDEGIVIDIIEDTTNEIINKIIRTTANEGDLIIDVFGGSGTTSKVADDLGFDTVSYDIDETYCEIMKDRTNCA